MHDFEKALGRPQDYFSFDEHVQWEIDKQLGILDWEGDCPHGSGLCTECQEKWNARFARKDSHGD